MGLQLAVAAESALGERRVAISPETAKKLTALGVSLHIERGAGLCSQFADTAYTEQAPINWCDDLNRTYTQAQLIFRVTPPSLSEIEHMPEGSVLVGLMRPFESPERLAAINARKISMFALELLPRISRAQSMDALSSQGACAGYQCALIGASHSPKFFPMLTTAAGTIRPARVLVIGAGVAGLQAIATAKRLGAMVEAYDVRSAAREQVESLGAKFVDTGVIADGVGGYARELTQEEQTTQAERLARAVAQSDVLITTAAIPGKRAPVIVTEQMIAGMKLGSVVVDMAAESGGNCALTPQNLSHDAHVHAHGIDLFAPINLPSRMPTHASELYAKNVFNFMSPFIKEGQLSINWSDEVVTGSLVCHEGQTVHPNVLSLLGKSS